MAPINKQPYGIARPDRAGRDSGETSIISRIKMLVAAGAVAGTIGGWGLLARHDVTSAAQMATPTATVPALIIGQDTPTPASTSEVMITLEVPGQSTPTATAVQPTATPVAQATATAAEPTATPSPQATATTATVKPAATAVPKAITTTRSSR